MDNKITPNKYDIYTKLLDIASNHIEDYENVDFLKTGMFGYITESLAMMMRDSSLYNSIIYNESFLNTANLPKSIYNWSRMFNLDVNRSIPAHAEIEIRINRNDLMSAISISGKTANTLSHYGEDVTSKGKNRVIIIDKNRPILAADYYFSLEHSILITQLPSGAFMAQYITTESPTTEFQNIKSKLLKVSSTSSGDIIIKARAYQYSSTRHVRQISSTSFITSRSQTFNFTDQFVDAKLYYTEGSVTEEIKLKTSGDIKSDLGLNGNNDLTLDKYALYNLDTEGQLELKFSSIEGNFIPVVNSTLTLFLFTTRGSDAPVEFSDIALFQPINGGFLSSSIGKNIFQLPNNISFFVNFNPTTIVGGIDSPSLNMVKQRVISELSSRNVIVTENDLNNYFLALKELVGSINDGNITFIKKRDDILKRVFGTYILLRDGYDANGKAMSNNYVSRCVPTNTIDARFSVSYNMSKPFGAQIKLIEDASGEFEYVPSSSIESDDYYVIPFYTRISLNPVRKVKYIYNLTDDYSQLSYRSITDTPAGYYMIPEDVSVLRTLTGTQASSYYEFIFNFTSNFKLENTVKSGSFNLSFYGKDTPTIPIEDLSYSSSNNKVNIVSTPLDESGGRVYNNTLTINVDVEDDEFIFENESSASDYGTFIHLKGGDNNTSISLPEEIMVNLEFKDLELDGVQTGKLNIKYMSSSNLRLFRNLDDIMFSDIEVHSKTYFKDTSGKYYDSQNEDPDNPRTEVKLIEYITVKDIPVVHSSFFSDNTNQRKFISQLFQYIDVIKENVDKLEMNTFFNLKFYNTHGVSNLYKTSSTNINLDLVVYLKNITSGIIDTAIEWINESIFQKQDTFKESLKVEIQDYIRRLVDDANKNKSVKISDIIAKISQDNTYGPYIDHIEFAGLNNTFNQIISAVPNISEREYTPEWLNINSDSIDNIRFEII